MSIADKLTTIAENEQKVYDKGVEDGKKSEYDAFWDAFQNYGKKMTYNYKFSGNGWTSKNFKPKYSLNTGNYSDAFYRCGDANDPIDLIKAIKECNITWQAEGGYYHAYYQANVKTVPTIDISDMTTSTGAISYTFYYSNTVETIEKIILPENNSLLFTETFTNNTSLKNITFEGKIRRTISFSSSPLSVESAKNVIEHLENYDGTADELKYRLTLKSTVWKALNNAEAPPSGETWKLYVNSLGWNCS